MPQSARIAKARRPAALGLLALCVTGCGVVPRSKLEDCHKLSRSLQAEVVTLRDSESRAWARYQDSVDRALVDQRRLIDLEDTLAQNEALIEQYRQDRERLAGELERVIRVVRSPGGVPLSLNDRLDAFVASHPGARLGDDGATCLLPVDRLFVPGRPELTPLGHDWLVELADLIGEFGRVADEVVVAPPLASDGDVVRTALPTGGAPATLDATRAEAVRAVLGGQRGLESARVRVAERDKSGHADRLAIRIRLGDRLDDGPIRD